MKVFEFAKEIGMETIALMDKIKEWDLPVKSHMASLSDDQLSEIKQRLEAVAPAKKKKAAKKKATKKVAAKKATKKKASSKADDSVTTKKKVTKKKVASSNVVEKVAKKSTAKVTKKTSAKNAATKKAAAASAETDAGLRRTVIRRASDDIIPEASKGMTAEDLKRIKDSENIEAAPSPKAEVVATAPAVTTDPVVAEEAVVEVEEKAVKKTSIKTVITKKNIIGRMDLSRVRNATRKPVVASSNNNTSTDSKSAPRQVSTRSRNLRSGFVAPAPMVPVDESKKRFEFKKKKPGAITEEPVVKGLEAPTAFKSADFRKKEAIFQPKRKKVSNLPGKKTEITTPAAHKRIAKINDNISVQDLAQVLNVKMPALTRVLVKQGLLLKPTDILDFDTVALIAPEFNYEAANIHTSSGDLETQVAFGDLEAEKVSRPPVVTVMGHVDHGKTTLLDSIRKAKVVAGEAGGITQHIGAYKVDLGEGKIITFIDTPGHAAFTEMRARGANVTDVVIIVVAADDGMMPQTQEAISHAKAAGVPIIVAVNKMDKEGANPDRIKQQLSDVELVPEEWGGSTIFVPVSALKGDGIDSLLENIYLVSEILELKANPKQSATGIVIESKVEKGKGTVATILVQNGTVKTGDSICVGMTYGRVRLMINDQGQSVKSAGPGEPVEISGLSETPQAGDRFDVCKDEKVAADLAETRKLEKSKLDALEDSKDKMSLDRIFSKATAGNVSELPIILKTDVAGSIEAIKGLLNKIESDEVKIKFVHSAVGGISESDVLLADAAGGIIIGFNVRPDTTAKNLSKQKSVEIKTYQIIYEIADDVKKAMSGLLSPEIREKEQGRAEVRDVFVIPKVGAIAGSFVIDGKIMRNDQVRLIRDGKIIYTGKLASLKRFKDDAKEVASGFECGIGIENYNDLKVGDIFETFVFEEIAREI